MMKGNNHDYNQRNKKSFRKDLWWSVSRYRYYYWQVTGVQYIVATKGSEGGGMYPLIDKDGKPSLIDVENQTPFD